MAKKEPSNNAKLTITVNIDQAYTLMNAMEMYARLHVGQFEHIDTEFAWNGQNCKGEDRHFWENSSVRESLRKHLLEAREIIFPELRVIGPNGSHGIFSHEISPSAHNAWDIYQVVRRTLAIHREPNPTGFSTSYNQPMQVSEKNPLPVAKIQTEGIKDKQQLLKEISEAITKYEDPTGCNCSNDVMAEISFKFGKEVYAFNGELFDQIKPKKKKATKNGYRQ